MSQIALRDRQYPAADLEFFATYREARQRFTPTQCNEGEVCWVRDGPPSMDNAGRIRCIGCDGPPLDPRYVSPIGR